MNEVEMDELVGAINLESVISSEKLSELSYHFLLQGKSRIWSIQLDVTESFPYCLPKAYLLDKELIGLLPHVNQRGVICLEESDSILCDHYRGQQIIETFLVEVIKLLDRVSLNIYQDELLDELEGYYNAKYTVNSFYEPSTDVEYIPLKIYRYKKQPSPQKLMPLAILGNTVSTAFSDVKQLSQFQTINILHLPLERAILPPKAANSLDALYIEGLYNHLNDANKNKLVKLLDSVREGLTFFIFISMPRSEGERTQLLVKLTASQITKHPLKESGNGWEVSHFQVTRNTKNFLAKRGGAIGDLSTKSVGIIGCGSVGGIIADALGKAGVGNLVLIDPDLLLPENIYRHFLGGSSVTYLPSEKFTNVKYWPKTHAVSRHLKHELPKINVVPLYEKFSEKLAREHLLKCDLIISAVGSPSTNLSINTVLKSLGHQYVIFCWNEAAGSGGHSTVHNLNETCLECLHRDHEGNFVPNFLSLIEPGQTISKNLTGCGGVFTPFSYLDSMKTAQMAASQTIKVLQGHKANFAESWKGDAAEPLLFTKRYEEMSLMERFDIKKSNNCGVCSE